MVARKPKICIVSSCGGHLTEVRCLLAAYAGYPHFYVLDDKALLPPDMEGRTYFITHSQRDWKFLLNLWEAWQLLRRERPTLILSTGAGVAVPVSLVARLLFGCHIVFIESITRITGPSLSGRVMYRIAHDFFYQWRGLQPFYPAGIHAGPLL